MSKTNETAGNILTKKDIRKAAFRYMFMACNAFNYENQQGQRVYVTEVIAENFQMLESREVTENRKQAANQTNQASNPTNTTSQPTQPFMDYSSFGGQSVEISEDDLPF